MVGPTKPIEPRLSKPTRSAQSQRFFNAVTSAPTKPQFPNSKPISEINREQRRSKQVPPDAPKKPSQPVAPVQPIEPPLEVPQLPKPEPITPPIKPRSEINFDAIAKEAARQKQELSRVSSKTQYELHRLAHGDAKMIDRLLIHTRSRNPDRPEQWIWEKVIRDLERDRGYR
ncbi:unknown protein [Leptolyngbya sp. NIES-3755]|nr:unknown protein [Leptolyngbya sp. NIES-3755]